MKRNPKTQNIRDYFFPIIITVIIVVCIVILGSMDFAQNLFKGELIGKKCQSLTESQSKKIDSLFVAADSEWIKISTMSEPMKDLLASKEEIDKYMKIAQVVSRDGCPEFGVFQSQIFDLPTNMGICVSNYKDSQAFAKLLSQPKKKEKLKNLISEFVPLHESFLSDFSGEQPSLDLYVQNFKSIQNEIDGLPRGACVSELRQKQSVMKKNIESFMLLGVVSSPEGAIVR